MSESMPDAACGEAFPTTPSEVSRECCEEAPEQGQAVRPSVPIFLETAGFEDDDDKLPVDLNGCATSEVPGAVAVEEGLNEDSCSSSSSRKLAATEPRRKPGLDLADPELTTDEGLALADALREAQAALDFARQFVTSPSLGRSSAKSLPQSDAQHAALQDPIDKVEAEGLSSIAPVPRETSPACLASAASVEQSAPDCARPSQEHVNALHARFGPNCARMRVAQQAASEKRHTVDKQRLVQQQKQRDAEEAAKSEPLRRQAALRAASARRAVQEEKRLQSEEEACIRAKRATNPESAQRYRNGAARRAKSEQHRRQSLAREVLADLEEIQRKRREESDCKGGELQERCEKSEWGHCRAVLSTQPGSKLRGPPAPPGPNLPRIVPSPRNVENLSRAHRTPRKPSSLDVTNLPPLIPSGH